MDGGSPMSLPVWMYWEGPCPEWVRACQQTVFRHGRAVRLLGPEEFDAMRDTDRDIDLSDLRVAQRADFVRAFLLARYGGLWVDSDCVVMKSLDSVLRYLYEYEFVAHFERFGRISNGFIASRPGGEIATAYYHRLCDILRAGKPLWWLALGAEALMGTLDQTSQSWYRLSCELVQPVCWSEPSDFFRIAPREVHEESFNHRSVCYMLANNMIRWYVAEHPTVDLLAAGTFFNFLLERSSGSSGGDTMGEPEAVTAAPASARVQWRHLAFATQALVDIDPNRVLDIGVGFARWGALVRQFCDERHGRLNREHWQVHVERVAPADAVEEYQWLLYDAIRVCDSGRFVDAIEGQWNLVILDQSMQDPDDQRAARLVEKAINHADYVLVVVAGRGDRSVPHASRLRHGFWPEVGGEGELSAFLLSLRDPGMLGRGETIGAGAGAGARRPPPMLDGADALSSGVSCEGGGVEAEIAR